MSQQKVGERWLNGDRRRYNYDGRCFEVASGSLLTRGQNNAMQAEHGLRILRQWNPNSPCPLIAVVLRCNLMRDIRLRVAQELDAYDVA